MNTAILFFVKQISGHPKTFLLFLVKKRPLFLNALEHVISIFVPLPFIARIFIERCFGVLTSIGYFIKYNRQTILKYYPHLRLKELLNDRNWTDFMTKEIEHLVYFIQS